jgi:hypothetical protein
LTERDDLRLQVGDISVASERLEDLEPRQDQARLEPIPTDFQPGKESEIARPTPPRYAGLEVERATAGSLDIFANLYGAAEQWAEHNQILIPLLWAMLIGATAGTVKRWSVAGLREMAQFIEGLDRPVGAPPPTEELEVRSAELQIPGVPPFTLQARGLVHATIVRRDREGVTRVDLDFDRTNKPTTIPGAL